MKVSTTKITPAMAEKMLKNNTNNRPLSDTQVGRLMREMKAGHWKPNGATIVFNGDTLIDGQHRLEAVRRSGCTITSLVVNGVSADAFSTLDTGKKRNAADSLSINGVKNAALTAAALVLADRYYTGVMPKRIHYSNTDVLELVETYPDVSESIRIASLYKKHITGLVPLSLLVGTHYIFSQLDPDEATAFTEDFAMGTNLHKADPILKLRSRLVQNSMAKSSLSREYILALIIKTWNARREGRVVTILGWKTASPFPTAV